MQALNESTAKMQIMTMLLGSFSPMRTLTNRFILLVLVAMVLLGIGWALTRAPEIHLQEQSKGTRVQTSLFLDESQKLGFETAREKNFQRFNPFMRLGLGDKVAWLRLHIAHADGASGPLFLHLLPPYLDEVTLYSPSPSEPTSWSMRTLDKHELLSKIEIGQAVKNGDFYLRVTSRNDVSLLAFVGGRDELNAHQRALDVVIAVSTTLMLLALASMLWRTFRQFNWMSFLVSFMLASVVCRYWINLGYAHSILGISSEMLARLAKPIIISNLAFGGGCFTILATELFPNQRWLRWFWAWSVFQMGLIFYAFFVPIEASRLSDFFWLVGPPVFCAMLLGAAVREPSSLRPFASKVALFALLITCVVMVLLSKQTGGIGVSPDIEITSELLIRNLLLRGIQPLVILAITTWLFDRLQANRLQIISGELQTSQDSLELETKRLERQRKFTAMLAHELKNPLAVSYMALSGIESRLGSDAPLLERAASIKQSLQEIDAIIDRCTEMDGYERGQLPMSMGSFTLNHFISALKVANPSERICILVRGIHDDALLISDIQYLKIILSNLLTNALKYSPADSMVELIVQSVIRDGETRTVEFSVSNEVGEAGTPSAELAFERFYRAEAARKQSGAGLGLWLSQALAHALGSQVVMQTKGEKISFSLTFSYV